MRRANEYEYQTPPQSMLHLRDQRYRPVGKLGNVYKCCEILRNTFQKYNLDSDLPDRHPHSKFLEGELELDSVAEHKRGHSEDSEGPKRKRLGTLRAGVNLSNMKQTDYDKSNRKANISLTQYDIRDLRDNGAGILQRELEDSYLRVKEAQSGTRVAHIVLAHEPPFYSTLPIKDFDPTSAEIVEGTSTPPRNSPATQSPMPRQALRSPILASDRAVSALRSRNKRISAAGIERAAMRLQRHRIPIRRNELLATFGSETIARPSDSSKANLALSPVQELSLVNSKAMLPHIQLLSLRDLRREIERQSAQSEIVPQRWTQVNPLKLVESISDALDKLIHESLNPTAKQLRRRGRSTKQQDAHNPVALSDNKGPPRLLRGKAVANPIEQSLNASFRTPNTISLA